MRVMERYSRGNSVIIHPIIDFISTGDEVLTGAIEDTNASWISQFLLEQGLMLSRRYTVADDLDALVLLFEECSQRADIVIVNGGLGPTEDDLSAEALACVLDQPLVMFDSWVESMRDKFETMNCIMSQANLKQALLPKSVKIIDNPVGTACGFKVQYGRAQFYFTPGVPHEFKNMMSSLIWDDMTQRFDLGGKQQVRRFFTFGFGESDLVEFLRPLALPATINLGYRSAPPFIEVKLTGAEGSQLDDYSSKLEVLLAEQLLFKDKSSLAAEIQSLMLAKQCTLALAESCTGGLVASTLVDEAGSSGYFDRAFITYSAEAKHEQLGVELGLIERDGVVSESVAAAMAIGALKNSRANIALAVTGVAGPEAQISPTGMILPAGYVVFALATKENTVTVACQFRYRSRYQVRQMAAVFVLDMLRRYLLNLPIKSTLKYII